MKIFFYISILIFITLIALIITKPSAQRCLQEFKPDLLMEAEGDFIRHDSDMKSMPAGMQLDAADSYAKKVWQNDFKYNDYFIFCTIYSQELHEKKKLGYGILNSIIHK